MAQLLAVDSLNFGVTRSYFLTIGIVFTVVFGLMLAVPVYFGYKEYREFEDRKRRYFDAKDNKPVYEIKKIQETVLSNEDGALATE